MNGRGFRLGSILGVEVRLDSSWFILFFLILWSLSVGVFPRAAPEQPSAVHVTMGVIATLLFFGSLLAHEISHSLVARAKGMPTGGITLFVFGGMAHTGAEPDTPGDELQIAGVGPLVSLVLGALFLGSAAIMRAWEWSAAAHEIAQYLGFINVALAVFNLLPGYPLDGGRVFRALAWKHTGSRRRATRWATAGGRWMGLALIVLGVIEAIAGALLGGLWLVFIGMFLRGAAGQALVQEELEHHLAGLTARDVMVADPQVVDARSPLGTWVRDRLTRTSQSAFAVVADHEVVGAITLAQIESTPRGRWDALRVADVMTPLDDGMVVSPDTGLNEVLRRVRRRLPGKEADVVLVMDSGMLVGLVSSSDVAEQARRGRLVATA